MPALVPACPVLEARSLCLQERCALSACTSRLWWTPASRRATLPSSHHTTSRCERPFVSVGGTQPCPCAERRRAAYWFLCLRTLGWSQPRHVWIEAQMTSARTCIVRLSISLTLPPSASSCPGQAPCVGFCFPPAFPVSPATSRDIVLTQAAPGSSGLLWPLPRESQLPSR